MYRSSYDEPNVADPSQLAEALRNLKPGEKLVYHRGHLRYASQGIRTVADMARVLFEAGNVSLHQVRLSEPKAKGAVDWKNGEGNGMEYIAIGIKPAS